METAAMPLIDVHCHLHDSRLISRLDAILRRARNCGVAAAVSCATAPENWDTTARICRDHRRVIPFFGIHPWFVDHASGDWATDLADRLSATPSGMGEIGLDFMDKEADREIQAGVFETQIDLARQMKRVVNIHVRKAWDDLVHLFKRTGPLTVPGLVHSYSGSADLVPVLEKFNLYISFSGAVTRPNAKKAVRALAAVSQDRFVLETDSPDLCPSLEKPFPGGRSGLNEPANLPAIARIAARLKGMDEKRFLQHAFENSLALLGDLVPGPVLKGGAANG